MKKQKMTQLLFTLFLLTASAFNTIKAQGREPLTYNGSMDTIYDMFGNKKTLSDIQFNIAENGNPNVLGNTTFSTSCGYFNVYYAANSGMELPTNQNHINRRAVICQVLSDVSALIVSPLSSNPNVKVNFLVDQQSVASSIGAAGAATAYYAQASSPTYTNPGIADNEIWKTIHSGQNSYIGVAAPVNLAISGFYHGYMAFDFTSMNWNEQLTAAPSSTVMDLYTVALHEITHALGFASLISATASGKYGELNNYYSRYDVFLRNKTNLPLIINPGSISPMYGYGFNPSVAVAELTPAATCTNDVSFAGSVNQKCYTPPTFSNGSSLSHFDEFCHTPTAYSQGLYYVMTPTTGYGVMKRYLKQEERMALCDIGYKTNTTYGNAAHFSNTTYTGSCNGVQVAGVNDGIANGTYIYTVAINSNTTAATTLTFSIPAILGNDYAVALPITASGVQNVYNLGTVAVSGNTITYTSPVNYSGNVLLRYVPVDANGISGNITYIQGFIIPSSCNPVSPCDMVQNGGFESINGTVQCGALGSAVKEKCWFVYKDTPDIFTKSCTDGYGAYNLGTNTYSSVPTWNSFNSTNNTALGLFETVYGTQTFNEAVQNYLGSALTNGTVYQLSYWYYNYSGRFKYPTSFSSSTTWTVNTTNKPCVVTFASNAIITAPNNTYPGALNTVISQTLNPPTGTWQYTSTTFTYTGPSGQTTLLFGLDHDKNVVAAYTGTTEATSTGFYVLFDDVSLVSVGITPTLTIPTNTICTSNHITDLGQYAQPVGGVFTGAGITNSGGIYSFNANHTLTAGTYSVTYTYTTGINCSYSTYAFIKVTPAVTVNQASVNVCGANSATLIASGATNYTWMPGSITSATAIVTPTTATVYTVTGFGGGSCATATVQVNPISSLCCVASNSTISNTNYPAGDYSTSGTIIVIQGVVTFTSSTSFNGYTFRMAPQAKLIVNNNVELKFTNCKLFGCSELWDGITILPSATNPGNIILNGTTIEDMYNGIVIDNANNPIDYNLGFLGKGKITITNSKLNKNYQAIQISNIGLVTTLIDNVYPLAINTSSFSSATSTTSPGNTLKPSATYTYAYNQITNGSTNTSSAYVNFPRAYKGIYIYHLNSSSNFVIGDNTNATKTNTFDNLDFGIYTKLANLQVYNNSFKNITGSLKSSVAGGTLVATGPSEIGIAVCADNESNIYDLTVGSNTVLPSSGNPYPLGNVFLDCNKGVFANSCKNISLAANVFTTSVGTDEPLITTTTVNGEVVQIINPNTYYYYKGQTALAASNLWGTGDYKYNYIRNQATGLYTDYTSNGGAVGLNVTNNDIAAPGGKPYCKQPIQINQIGGGDPNKITITTNTIANAYNGISVSSITNKLTISKNAVNIENVTKTKGYTSNFGTLPRNGIRVLNCQYAKVQGNTLTSISAVPTTTATAVNLNGVYITNSPNSSVECNITTQLGRCFVFEGTCSTSRWLTNTQQNSYRGLELANNGVIGKQGDLPGVITPNLSANTWATITQETYANASPSVNVTSKLFLLANGSTQPTLNFASAGVNAYSTIFGNGLQVTTGVSYTCNANGGAQRLSNGVKANQKGIDTTQVVPDSLTLYANLALANPNTYDVFADEFTYQNKQLVYQLLDEDSVNVLDGSKLDNFYDANQTSAIGVLTDVQQAMADNNIALAISKNAAVPVTNSVEQKHQRANELVLQYLNNNTYSYSATDINDLRNMANECVAKGVYVTQSRNLLTVITKQIADYVDNCDAQGKASRKHKDLQPTMAEVLEAGVFNLYPNPNNGTMLLEYDLGENNQYATLQLVDVTGKLINNYNIQTNKGTLTINEQALHNGIYFYRILVGDKLIKTNKVVIIK